MPSKAELNTYYEAQYRLDYQKAATPHSRHILRAFRTALRRYEALKPHMPASGRTLDVGAGGGEWTSLLSKTGYESVGVEPSPGFAEHARRAYGAKVIAAPLDLAGVEGPFDLVTAFHVFEHLPDPAAAFTAIRRMLGPNGRLIVEVPNIAAPYQTKRSKFHFAHVIGFTSETLEAIAKRCGYRLVADLGGGPDSEDVRIIFAVGDPQPTALPSPASVDRTAALLRRARPLHARSVPNAARKLFRSLEERITTQGKSASEIAEIVLTRVPGRAVATPTGPRRRRGAR
jgi:SAM-dependent methyltransferase